MSDWSKLITVNFVGGFCGDFICSLVYNSYYESEISFFKDVTKAKFSPNFAKHRSVAFSGEGFRNIDILTQLFYNQDKYSFFIQEINNVKETMGYEDDSYRQISKIYNTCVDKDRTTFINNVYDYCRTVVPPSLKDYTIITHHSCDLRTPEFRFKNIFPGSNNVAIVATDQIYNRYFRLLGYHKFYGRLFKDKTLKESFQLMRSVESDLLKFFENLTLDLTDEKLIYVDKFLFAKDFKYVEEMESMFSSIMGKQLVFDRDAITTYRNNNRKIYSNYLNVPEDFDYKDPSVLSKLNSFMDDVQGTNG